MREQQTLGNGAATTNIIADGLDFVIDPQVTNLQLWNVLLANLRNFDVVGSIKHDLYPYGFTGVILLMDGHIAAQYGIHERQGALNVTICSNAGSIAHQELRQKLWRAFDKIQP